MHDIATTRRLTRELGMADKIGIPIASVDLSGNEEKYVLDAVRSSWISSTGAFVQQFEEMFADLCQTRTAIGVCNGAVLCGQLDRHEDTSRDRRDSRLCLASVAGRGTRYRAIMGASPVTAS